MLIHLEDISNYLQLSEQIGSGGQPLAEQFPLLQQSGYQVVINLALPDSRNAIAHEGALVAGLGMTYVHIPVIWEAPALEDFRRFEAVMQAFTGSKIFVHCALNMRVSCFLYGYRVLHWQMDPSVAALDLHKIWQPDPVWQALMEAILHRDTPPMQKEKS